jgi:hypothetical protein
LDKKTKCFEFAIARIGSPGEVVGRDLARGERQRRGVKKEEAKEGLSLL